ncbi:hypothetical protein PsAD37_04010 [Pseudovibrio sp. Ad37]|nr:hypothetical protein PsAD37_04010 [Pseudovibrio sp. Ad37]
MLLIAPQTALQIALHFCFVKIKLLILLRKKLHSSLLGRTKIPELFMSRGFLLSKPLFFLSIKMHMPFPEKESVAVLRCFVIFCANLRYLRF